MQLSSLFTFAFLLSSASTAIITPPLIDAEDIAGIKEVFKLSANTMTSSFDSLKDSILPIEVVKEIVTQSNLLSLLKLGAVCKLLNHFSKEAFADKEFRMTPESVAYLVCYSQLDVKPWMKKWIQFLNCSFNAILAGNKELYWSQRVSGVSFLMNLARRNLDKGWISSMLNIHPNPYIHFLLREDVRQNLVKPVENSIFTAPNSILNTSLFLDPSKEELGKEIFSGLGDGNALLMLASCIPCQTFVISILVKEIIVPMWRNERQVSNAELAMVRELVKYEPGRLLLPYFSALKTAILSHKTGLESFDKAMEYKLYDFFGWLGFGSTFLHNVQPCNIYYSLDLIERVWNISSEPNHLNTAAPYTLEEVIKTVLMASVTLHPCKYEAFLIELDTESKRRKHDSIGSQSDDSSEHVDRRRKK